MTPFGSSDKKYASTVNLLTKSDFIEEEHKQKILMVYTQKVILALCDLSELLQLHKYLLG